MRSVSQQFSIIALLLLPYVIRAQSQPQTPPRPSVSDAVSAHYLAVAESASATPQARALWQARLDLARDTLESVLEWYNQHDESSSSLRTLLALAPFWNGPSFVSAFERAFAAPVGKDSVVRARALNTASAAAFRIKDQTKTRTWARQSIALWTALADSAGMGRAYQRLVQAALRDGNHPSLRALADTGHWLCARARDQDCQAYFINMRGESARVLQQYDSAAVYYAEADMIYRRISPTFQLGIAHNIGFTLLALGRTREARLRITEGLQHAVANANRPYVAFMLAGIASCDAADGNGYNAAKLFGLSDAALEKTGRVADPADAVEYERYRSRARNQLGAVAFADSVKAGRTLPLDSVLAAMR